MRSRLTTTSCSAVEDRGCPSDMRNEARSRSLSCWSRHRRVCVETAIRQTLVAMGHLCGTRVQGHPSRPWEGVDNLWNWNIHLCDLFHNLCNWNIHLCDLFHNLSNWNVHDLLQFSTFPINTKFHQLKHRLCVLHNHAEFVMDPFHDVTSQIRTDRTALDRRQQTKDNVFD